MPDPITSSSAGASYEIGAGPPPQANPATEPDGDTVEISSGPAPAPPTYGPPDVADRFRFDIQNGMFDKRLRYTPLRSRYEGAATQAYSARASVGSQVAGTAGAGGLYSALFSLGYADARPDSDQVASNSSAKGELNRMADQRLSLLNSL